MNTLGTNNVSNFSYTMADAATMLTNPLINSRPKLFRFLREFGIIDGMNPRPELIVQGYFTVIDYRLPSGNGGKMARKVLVSRKGIAFINKLAKLIYGI